MKKSLIIIFVVCAISGYAQQQGADSTGVFKKRVLESTEVDLLMSYYNQDGNHAAVTGGEGTEKLSNYTPTIVVSVPLNDDDVLTIDGEISAYTSASSSNINPFDGNQPADPFVASSGASSGDVWLNGTGTYSHSSDDRNKIWSAKLSLSNEFDYFSFGFGGSYTRLFNEKNTEVSLSANVYLDTWFPVYPIEFRSDYRGFYHSPYFTPFTNDKRNSYSAGLVISQVFSKRLQGSFAADYILQKGLLSTPFQRVYFSDVQPVYVENFRLADDIERLPDTRYKVAFGGRLNYYINEIFVARAFYRYYFDEWGIRSNTFSLEIPVKISGSFTLYPSYRYYDQTAADYFAPYAQHLSTDQYYTSDYDLSGFSANQYGFGVTYTDIFTKFHVAMFGLKSIDLRYYRYSRNIGFDANLISFGAKFIMD